MTRPAPWRRTTAAERRAQRAAFKDRKEQLAASPEMVKRRAKARSDNVRSKTLAKVKGAVAGEAVKPFSQLQVAKIRPAEHALLCAEVRHRLDQLTADQRRRLTANQHLILVAFSVEQMRAVASVEGAA